MGPTYWNRDAIVAERAGFDCSKGHPAMGNYHHHQNPSAFKLDLNVISTICNLYNADGLYTIDTTKHSPLLGFAHDGFPVYGAYGYKNANGTGGITRMKSGYQLRSITVRTHHADGTDVPDGPVVSSTYPLGYFREDYEFVPHTGQEDYLDEHNGRFCVTPEYPAGTYAYFCTVDANHNSAYPYIVGPTFYGNVTGGNVTTISETTTVYEPVSVNENHLQSSDITVFPNPASDLIAIQISGLLRSDCNVELFDFTGKRIQTTRINSGQTIGYFDTQTLHNGTYLIRISSEKFTETRKVTVNH